MEATATDAAGKHSDQERARARFETLTARYFYQLTRGCGRTDCPNAMCASSSRFTTRLSAEAGALLAIQYAVGPRAPRLCDGVAALPLDVVQRALRGALGHDVGDLASAGPHAPQSQARAVFASRPLLRHLVSALPFGKPAVAEPPRRLAPSMSLSSLATVAGSTPLLPKEGSSVTPPVAKLGAAALSSVIPRDVKSDLDLPSLAAAIQGIDSLSNELARTSRDGLVGSGNAESTAKAPLEASSSISQDVVPSETDTTDHNVAAARALSRHLLELANQPEKGTETAQELEDAIQRVFSRAETLGNAFEDVTQLRRAYAAVLDDNSSALLRATQIVLGELELLFASGNWRKALPAPLMHALVAVLENPLFGRSNLYDLLTKRLCGLLGRMRSRPRAALVTLLAAHDAAGLRNMVDAFQGFLGASFQAGSGAPSDAVVHCVKALSILHLSSERGAWADRGPPKVPASAFYNEAVCARVQFKEEYRRWKHLLTKPPPVTSFSVFFFPFLLPPAEKGRVLHIDAMAQMSSRFEDAFVKQAFVVHAQRFLPESTAVDRMEAGMQQAGMTNPYLVLEVRREALVEDTLAQITRKAADLKKPLKVKFVRGGEEGLDQGGVQKEFFQVLADKLLDPEYGMFQADSETRLLWFSPFSLESLRSYELIGTVLGLALYNGVFLCVPFPPALYRRLLGYAVGLPDLAGLSPALARGLSQLLEWSDGDVSDIFLRSFVIEYSSYGATKRFELCANGDDVPVTNTNRSTFVRLYVEHVLVRSVESQFEAFRRGFLRVVDGDALRLCAPDDLEMLLCGSAELNFEDLRLAAQYDDDYGPDMPYIRDFWDIVLHEFTAEQRRQLLVFVTASDRVPLQGLGRIQFVVQRNGPDTDRLPTSLTCFGRLLLPQYSSREKLRDKLATALGNSKGFGLV